MPEDLKILTARRAYEFRVDDIRLTMLSIAPVQQAMRQAFLFQGTLTGQAMDMFGPVPASLPPPLVFTSGVWTETEGLAVPIRLLQIEQRRIVVDVAGPSSAIDGIFDRLRQLVAGISSPDGSPAVGEPVGSLDYTEISGRYAAPIEAGFAPGLGNLLSSTLMPDGHDGELVLVPSFMVQLQAPGEEFPGLTLPNPNVLQFQVRAGTKPAERIYFSAAPLDTDRHLQYVESIEALLTRQSVGAR